MSNSSCSFVGNVLKLTGASAFGQALGILVAPIATRLFPPTAFGVAALFGSVAGTVAVVACLEYHLSIMLPDTDQEASNLLGLSLLWVVVISGLCWLALLLVGDEIVRIFNSPGLKPYLWLVPISIAVNGLSMALIHWNSRTKHFGIPSIARIVEAVIRQTFKLGAGFAGLISGGVLIWAIILGNIAAATMLAVETLRRDVFLFIRAIRWKEMISGLKRYRRFPLYTIWTALLDTASQHLPILLLAFFFSPEVVAFYALGRGVVNMPLHLVGRAIGQVFFQKAAEMRNQSVDLGSVTEELFRRLVSLGLVPLLMLTLIGKDLFILAFGTRWAEAGVYSQFLAPWFFFMFISAPLSNLLNVLEKQKEGLFLAIMSTGLRAGALVAGGLFGDERVAIALFACASLSISAFLLLYILSIAGVPVKRGLTCLARYTAYSMPTAGSIFFAKWVLSLNPLALVCVGCVSAVPYYLIILKQDEMLQKTVIMTFQKVRLQKPTGTSR